MLLKRALAWVDGQELMPLSASPSLFVRLLPDMDCYCMYMNVDCYSHTCLYILGANNVVFASIRSYMYALLMHVYINMYVLISLFVYT